MIALQSETLKVAVLLNYYFKKFRKNPALYTCSILCIQTYFLILRSAIRH